MESCRHILTLLTCCLVTVTLVYSSDGPVFVNPNAPKVIEISTSTSNSDLLTQTVYGFLDFTTTIGNTVMVFSPQSSEVPIVAVKPQTEKITIKEVIQTKPVKAATEKPIEIKPSKTELHKEKKASNPPKKIASIVQVKSDPPITSSKVSNSRPSTKINIIEAVSSVVNVASDPITSSKVQVVEAASTKIISKVEIVSSSSKLNSPVDSSRVEVVNEGSVETHPDDVNEPPAAVIFGNNIADPEYDFFSRQPSEVVEETYKVINLKPSSKFILKPRPAAETKNKALPTKRNTLHPTGLVTKLGGTVVKDGTTTVHETSVIGTYISGKYAQVLQSTSHIQNGPQHKGKISPSPSLRILKTASPSLGKSNKHHRHLDPTPSGSVNQESVLSAESSFNSIKTTVRKPAGQPFKLRYKNRQKENSGNAAVETAETNESRDVTPQPNYKKSQRARAQSPPRNPKHNTSHRPHKSGRNNRKHQTTTTPSVHSEAVTPASSFGSGKRYQSRRNKLHRPNVVRETPAETTSGAGYSRRTFKPKVQTSPVEQSGSSSTSLYKFKLNRSPGRWQYKTTPKPRVTIRKQNNDDEFKNETLVATTPHSHDVSNDITPQSRQDDVDGLEGSESIASIIDDSPTAENKLDTPVSPLETIRVEISTPPDFKDIYYEIATIKSPYTFQVGSVRNTRFITVTSTFEKSLVNTAEATISPSSTEPLTENILATSSNYDKDNNFLDSSVATLPPIYLASDMETPPLETLTETFSTTQTMLKTHILPIIRSPNDTSTTTLVQTYLVTRLVSATKTLPPMEAYHFIPSKTLKDFNSHLDEAGSELHLELEFGDQNDQEDGFPRKAFPPDLDLTKIGSDFNLSDVDKSKMPEALLRLKKANAPSAPKPQLVEQQATPGLSPDQLQQLAFYRLLNPAAGQGQVITTSKPVLKVETVYESHVIPITNGPSTFLTTLSKVVGTVTKTDYEFGTSTLAPALPLPPVGLNPLFPQVQQQFTVTSSPVVQSTLVTQTNSKILKITFGAKTARTTVYSTTVVPSLVTSYVTASVPVQPSAAFPGYFPAPYPPFPYVG